MMRVEEMRGNEAPVRDLLVRRLGQGGRLKEADRMALAGLPLRMETVPAHRYLVHAGDRTAACCLLVTGCISRHRTEAGGGRQILAFHLAGDLLNLEHFLLRRADDNLQALTTVTVAWIATEPLRDLVRARPAIASALWRCTLVDASIFCEWVLNVGRRDARARIAHLLCEFAARSAQAGLSGPDSMDLPMTQEDLADATGLTSVHVNRMLQALTRDGILQRAGRKLQIIDAQRLHRIAGFNPDYLHLAA